ncbi:protein VAPYRIN-like [Aristolochia californica]|uniref:protein VAPYRIN-like n=1 Tax=Aristolochia californica TaxID=171875 RepID=UPI0035E39425
MEKLVQVTEQEVQIDFILGCKCRAKIHLKSLSPTSPVAFKVQTSAPHKFLVSPPNGLIPPAASTSFQVILKPQSQIPPSFPKSPSDRFLIKIALAPDLESSSNDNGDHQLNTWFSSSARATHDIKLKVVYVGLFLLRHAVNAGDVDAVKHIIKRQKTLLPCLSPREAAALLQTAPNAEMLDVFAEAGLVNYHPVDGKEEDVGIASKGWTPLHVAAVSGRGDVVERLLIENGEKGRLESRDTQGRTPLHLAASKGHLLCLRRLVEGGADVNAKSDDGRTALFRAAANGSAEIVAQLLEMGADPSIAAEDVTPVDVAQDKGHENVVEILQRGDRVLTAARRGEIDRLKSLLEKPGRVLNFCDQYGLTALHSAAIKGHAEIVAMLAEFGMDVESRDVEGHTPLHLAVESGSRDAVETLIDRGANVNARSKRGATPLYMAILMGNESITQILKNRGASPTCGLPSSSSSVSSSSLA